MESPAEMGDLLCGICATTILVTDEDGACPMTIVDHWFALGELVRKIIIQEA